MSSSNATSAAPFSVPASGWSGNDGKWSSFTISVGTPPQSFSVWPSLTGAETWVPLPVACTGPLANISGCAALRGVHNFEGKPSTGFSYTDSSSWQTIGLYQLSGFQELFQPSANGLYGTDTVSLFNQTGTGQQNISFPGHVVAGYAAVQSWIGSLGVGTAAASFKAHSSNISSLLTSMATSEQIPGSSVGYTAGAYYASQTPGSLTLGGYDESRFHPSNISFPLEEGSAPRLPVTVASIVADGLDGTLLSFLPDSSFTAYIDTTLTVSQFPQAVCDRIAAKYGLRFDDTTGLYQLNASIHNQLLALNPNITFTLSPTDNASLTTNIAFPYAAFDLQAGVPIYNYSTNYFPLRPALATNQIILGRQFMQEAYVFVDWDRKNFTLGQAIHQNSTTSIIAVESPANEGSSSSSISGGAIAGIVIGVIAAIALIAALIFFLLRRRRRQKRHTLNGEDNDNITSQDEKNANDKTQQQAWEIGNSSPIHELHPESRRAELSGVVYSELPGDVPIQEADSTPIGFSYSSAGTDGTAGTGMTTGTDASLLRHDYNHAYGGLGHGHGHGQSGSFPVSPLSGASSNGGGSGTGSARGGNMSIVSPISGSGSASVGGYGSESATGSSAGRAGGAGAGGQNRIVLLGELPRDKPPSYRRGGGG